MNLLRNSRTMATYKIGKKRGTNTHSFINNAYTITILTVPSFFVTAISQALIPEVSKNYLACNYKCLKKRKNQMN